MAAHADVVVVGAGHNELVEDHGGEVVVDANVAPSRVPASGGATVKLLSVAPYQLAEGIDAWDERKAAVADGLIARYARTVENYRPGGSVSGRPGRNAARIMLSELGFEPRELMADA